MKLKTIFKVIIRLFSVWIIVKNIGNLISLIGPIIQSFNIPDYPLDQIYAGAIYSAIMIFIGAMLIVFTNKIIWIFGKDYDFEERIDALNINGITIASYVIIGIFLVTYSLPEIISEYIKYQNNYYSNSKADISAILGKTIIVENLIKFILGVLLIVFRKRLPPIDKNGTAG